MLVLQLHFKYTRPSSCQYCSIVWKYLSFLMPRLKHSPYAILKKIGYIQHLPKSTAIPAVHLQIQAQMDILTLQTLMLFRTIINAEAENPYALYIRGLINRQLATKDANSSRWTAYVIFSLHPPRYNSPKDML